MREQGDSNTVCIPLFCQQLMHFLVDSTSNTTVIQNWSFVQRSLKSGHVSGGKIPSRLAFSLWFIRPDTITLQSFKMSARKSALLWLDRGGWRVHPDGGMRQQFAARWWMRRGGGGGALEKKQHLGEKAEALLTSLQQQHIPPLLAPHPKGAINLRAHVWDG